MQDGTPDGRTPLTTSAMGGAGAISACTLLLEEGAGINVPNKAGRTPLMCAAGCGHTEVAPLPQSSARMASEVCPQVVRMLLARGASVSLKNQSMPNAWDALAVCPYS